MWKLRCWPDYSGSGGKGPGVYASTDEGDNWDRQEKDSMSKSHSVALGVTPHQ